MIDPASILQPIFEQRLNRITPDLPFAQYQDLAAVNASLLRQPTSYEQLNYLLAHHSLDAAERMLSEQEGDNAREIMDRVQRLTPRTVPVKLARLMRMPGETEKASDKQIELLDSLKDGPVDSREYNSATLGACQRKGWIIFEDAEREEVSMSPQVLESRAQSLAIGTATHAAILEPHLFDADTWQMHWQLSPTKGLTTALAREALAADPSRELITSEIVDTARRCRDAVYRHRLAAELLSAPGQSELTVEAWDDEALCMRKARIDRLPDDRSLGIVDVKTTHTGLVESQFRGSVFRFGYHLQAAFYLDTLAKLEVETREKFHIVAVTKEAPFICRVFELCEPEPDRNAVLKGRDIYLERLVVFMDAFFKHSWEAYENEGAKTLAI